MLIRVDRREILWKTQAAQLLEIQGGNRDNWQFHFWIQYKRSPYNKRRDRKEGFEKQKKAFEQFLLCECNREILSLDVIDDIIAPRSIKIHELSFPSKGRIPIDLSILKEILEGMVDYLKRYRNLQIILIRRSGIQDMAWRLKEDRLILLHCFDRGEKTCIYSENWLFIDYYMNLLETACRGKSAVRGKQN